MRPVSVLLFVSFFFVLSLSVFAGYSLVVEGIPGEVDSTQSFSYSASFSGEPRYYANKTYFLRSVFCSPDSTSYFGFILNGLGNWVSNPEEKSELFNITISPEGTWSGQLQAVADTDGSVEGFSSGEYSFKLGRYTSSADSSADWTTPISLFINFPSTSPTDIASTSTPEPTSTSTSTPTLEPETTTTLSLTIPSTPLINRLHSIFLGSNSASPASGSVLATSSSKTRSVFPPLLVFGGGLFMFSASLFLSKSKFPRGKR